MNPFRSLSEAVRRRERSGSLRRWAAGVIPRAAAGLRVQDLRALARGEDLPRPDPRYRAHYRSFWLHIKPIYYHEAVTRFNHTFRLGLLSTYLFFLEAITGILLMFYYVPSPERAYGDILRLSSGVPFGQLVRDLHRLSAEGMVVVVGLHLVRTFLTGSYKKPRQFTWLTGVVLLLATLLVTFTGYLLPWDQLAYWAATVGAGIAELARPIAAGKALQWLLFGGPEIGAGSLMRFYLLHVLFVPGVILAIFAVHYYKVVRTGISLPSAEEKVGEDTARRVPLHRRRFYLPDLLLEELLFLAIVTCILLALIVFRIYPGAPLAGHADPLRTPAHIQAPWFFLWIQGLLKLGNPTWMGVILPSLLVVLLFFVPYIDRNPSRRARDRRTALGLFAVVCAALVVLTWMGTARFAVSLPPAAQVVDGVFPEDGIGPLRALPWETITVGEWDTRTYETSASSTAMRQVMARYADLIAEQNADAAARGGEGLPGGYGKVIVEGWQSDLKKVIARVIWQPVGGPEQVFERSGFIHRDTGR